MMKQHTVGIDISKAHLEAHRRVDGQSARFANDQGGFQALIDWIGTPVECVAYEATGPYHWDFEEALSKAKLPLARVNPWQARRFAEATGSRAKTDTVDARMLAQLAASLDPRRTPVPSKTQRRLQELQTSRDSLMRQRTAALNRRAQLRDPLLKRQNQTQINLFERHVRAIDRQLQQLIQSDPERARKLEILTSIPGIATTTATGLLAEMPELGTLTAKAAASLAGLAAVPRESGTWQGRAFIRGGRQRARRLLYMPAVSTLRWNRDLAAVYRRLTARGKPGKVALVAVMRKLIVLANTLVRQDRNWLPEAPRGPAGQIMC